MSKERKYNEAIEELEKLLAEARTNYVEDNVGADCNSFAYTKWCGFVEGINCVKHRLETENTASRVEEKLQALEEVNKKLATVTASRKERGERLGIPPVTTLELAQAYAEEHGLVLCKQAHEKAYLDALVFARDIFHCNGETAILRLLEHRLQSRYGINIWGLKSPVPGD